MNPKGNIWLAVGRRNAGKTYTAMQIAEEFFRHPRVRKSIIVFDHTNNSSYNTYGLTQITLEQMIYVLPYQLQPIRAIVRGVEIDEFADVVINYISQCSILFDDCGVMFRGNLTMEREKLLKTPKNNGTELIFQAHSIREIAPALLEQANMYIIKQTNDDPDTLPNKLIAKREISQLLIDTIRENYNRPANEKFATRVYDVEDDSVWVQDQNGIFQIAQGEDYFPFSAKKRYLS